MRPSDVIARAFVGFGLPVDAQVFLLKVWEIIQILDDLKDGHAVQDVDNAIYTLLIGLPGDEFLASHRSVLMGAMVTAYHKWQTSNDVEERHDASNLDKTYMWRAGYYDLILLVMALCLPREEVERLGSQVLSLYGETRDEYVKEISGA